MKRANRFLLIVFASIACFGLITAWYLFSYQAGAGSFGGMMGQMYGNGYTGGMFRAMPIYAWVAFLLIFVALIAGVAGSAYYFTFPEISGGPDKIRNDNRDEAGAKLDWSTLIRTSKPEERKVLEVLAAHGGKYLQKFVVKEAGLSKLKTHRIISRFAERGVVTAEKKGNTNEVSLASWIKDVPAPAVPA